MATTNRDLRTLLTLEEYERIMSNFSNPDFQTNHYFDTSRFSLKAEDCSLRVRERETFELVFKIKKSYETVTFSDMITKEQLEKMVETGDIPKGDVKPEVKRIIKDQKLVNFMNLSTVRLFMQCKNGVVYLDKSTYCGMTDYELYYNPTTNYYQGRKEFVELIRDFNIVYKKCEKKIIRTYEALKRFN